MTRSFLARLKRRLQGNASITLALELERTVRRARRVDDRMVTLAAEGQPQGRVLLAYVVDGFLQPLDAPASAAHTNVGEGVAIGRAWARLGYTVDVISYKHTAFVPQRPYDVFVGSRIGFERLARLLGPDCLKILHITTSHWLTQEAAECQRLLAVQARRGVTLLPRRYEPPNLAIEHADCATMLGNDVTRRSWAYAGRPIHAVPIPTVASHPSPAGKDVDRCRHRFLWLGSYGLVHKGLDVVLEAVAGAPDLELVVCGPVEREPDFAQAYHRELRETPNVRTHGWVDVRGPEFRTIAAECVGLAYPSCSEGQAGAVVTSMGAGLIPVVSPESGVDVAPETGVLLDDCSVAGVRAAMRAVAALPSATLSAMAMRAWEQARAEHTLERFTEAYGAAVDRILAGHARPAAARAG